MVCKRLRGVSIMLNTPAPLKVHASLVLHVPASQVPVPEVPFAVAEYARVNKLGRRHTGAQLSARGWERSVPDSVEPRFQLLSKASRPSLCHKSQCIKPCDDVI